MTSQPDEQTPRPGEPEQTDPASPPTDPAGEGNPVTPPNPAESP